MTRLLKSFCAAVVAAACVIGISSTALGDQLRVSVMGDSYSSWNPAALPGHYAQSCAGNSGGYGFGGYNTVTSVDQTYWMLFINHIGGVLEINNAWESSRISHGGNRVAFTDAERIDDIGDPDVLLICGGMNDAWGTGGAAAPLGDYKYSDWTSNDLTQFRPALAYLIDHQLNAHPGLEIIVVINSNDDASGGSGVPGLTVEWCNSMKTIAEHYGVMYVQCHNIEKESWHPTANGYAAMAAQIAEVWDEEHSFATLPTTPEAADPSVQVLNTAEGTAYVFTNTASTIKFAPASEMRLVRALVVGGGGEGGHVIGGGGGGGAVVEMDDPQIISAGTQLKIKVGAGGAGPNKPANGAYKMNDGSGWHQRNGVNGEESFLRIGTGIPYSAPGGGGGASWGTNNGSQGANGGGGSGTGGGQNGRGGAPLSSSGFKGGDVTKGSGPNDYFGGGGGGAAQAGEDGNNVTSYAGRGGEGVTNNITGVAVVYGSGGGGGGGNAVIAAAGGTNGGAGGAGNAQNSGRIPPGQPGFPGVNGTGSGGGGGGFEYVLVDGDYPSYTGGNGGDGTVILVFAATSDPIMTSDVSDITRTSATIGFTLVSPGADATEAEIFLAYGTTGNIGNYVSMGTLLAGQSDDYELTGLTLDTQYEYNLKAVNNAQEPVEVVINGSFSTLPPFKEVTIEEADPSVQIFDTAEGTVYVFTNTTKAINFAYGKNTKIVHALLVGGGGEGGHIIAGGGGGGQVIEITDEIAIPAQTTVTINIGKGGTTADKPTARYDMNVWPGYDYAGGNGGSSTLTIGSTTRTAAGGGGGWSWHARSGGDGANGGGGSGEFVENSYGHGQNGGHDGGKGGIRLGEQYDLAAGGGGGAGEDGEDGGTVAMTSGRGGEGITCSITGVNVVYGSGGGGGGGNGIAAAAGGTNGGAGGDGNLAGDPLGDPTGRVGYPGVDGTGSGGGGGGFRMNGYHCYAGGDGGSGTIILVFPPSDDPAVRTSVSDITKTSATIDATLVSAGLDATQATISLAYGTPGNLGSYVEKGMLQHNASGHYTIIGLTAGTEYAYSVKAVNNAQEPVEVIANGTFTTEPPFHAILPEEADPSVQIIDTAAGTAYVFTNTAKSVTFVFAKNTKLLRALVVGGGGEGGHIIAGGGGGGQVLELDDAVVIPAETNVTIKVGAGGSTPGKPWHYPMNTWNGHNETAIAGESSTLTIGSTTSIALGGGGGWSWDSTSGGNGANGGGGAGERVANSYGLGLNGGHNGGKGGVKLPGQYDYAAGGGAGAAQDGEDGGTVNQTSGRGGEGITNNITGVAVVYGSGGGGGGGNGILAAVGGTNGGAGGDGNLAGDVNNIVGRCGANGVDGTGSGGGGGGFKMDGLNCYTGGNGGSGTVILLFKKQVGTIFLLQ